MQWQLAWSDPHLLIPQVVVAEAAAAVTEQETQAVVAEVVPAWL
jgi:hypothetical protein